MNRILAVALGMALTASASALQAQKAEFTVVEGSAPRDPTNTLPLKTTRILRFTTDEGTWMSVALSPDGKTLLFDLLGDIYSMPASGGKATRILGGNSIDVQPSFSPNGKLIAFISDRSGDDQLWIANADGSNPTMLSTTATGVWNSLGFPTWTPDGEYVLAGTTMYHISGGAGVKVPFGGAVSFSPDGNRVYSGSGGGVMMYDRITGKSRTIAMATGGAMQATVSPDEKKLVYFTRYDARTGMMVRDLATGEEKMLRMDVQHDAGERGASLGAYPRPAWTKDGSAVITFYGGKLWRVDASSGKATSVPFSADVEQYLGPLVRFQYPITDTFTVRQIRDATPSPDLKHLAFTALDKLYLTSLNGGGAPTRVTSAVGTVEHSPAWSPDGKYVVFATWSDEEGGQLYRVNANGSGLKKLTSKPAFYARPAYSPDGRRLVFAVGPWVARRNYVDRLTGSLDAGTLNLAWMNADGGEIHEIVDVGDVSELPDGANPHFGPDTGRVLFSTGGLTSIRWDGTDRRSVYTGSPVVLSPNGKFGFTNDDGAHLIYIFPAPLVGSPVALGQNTRQSMVPSNVAIGIGGDFPGWTKDGKYVYFSLGRSFFLYDVTKGSAARADSLAKAWQRRLAGDTLPTPGADTLPNRPAYEPQRFDIAVTVAAAKPKGVVALKGARLITMKGHEVIEKGDLVVTDNRITAIGPSGTVNIPSEATVIDVSGKTIIPGYVDVHAHTWPSVDVHKSTVPAYHANLAFGVTTMRDPQTNTSDVVTYGDRLRAGDLLGPRFYGTGEGIFGGFFGGGAGINSLTRAREVIRRYADFYGTQTVKEYLTGNRRQRQLLLMASREYKISPTTEGAGDFKMSMTEMLDGFAGHEHAYEIWPLYRDIAILSAASGMTYTPTMLVAYGGPENKYYLIEHENAYSNPKLRRFTLQPDLSRRTRQASWNPEDEYIFKGVSGAAANIVAHGGLVGVGAHHEVQGMGTPWDLRLQATGGMPNIDVLRVGTIFGAISIGLDKDLGSLEVGQLADLQVLDANPLDDIKNIERMKYVMRNGELYEAETLDQVWPVKKPLPHRWWWDWGPQQSTAKIQ